MDAIEQAARSYLKSKRVTLWADWDITRPDSFDKAVGWLTETVDAVNAIAATPQVEKIVTENGREIKVSKTPRVPGVDPMFRVDL